MMSNEGLATLSANNETTFESFCSVYLCLRRDCQGGMGRLTSSFFIMKVQHERDYHKRC